MTTRVLFVCLGNICRSPTAEGVFRSMLSAGDAIETDSAGTGGWHIGNPPDPRAIEAAAARGIDISSLRARQATPDDFHRFDLILAMDRSNLADLEVIRPKDARADLRLMLRDAEVPDPYYEGGFGPVFTMLEDASRTLLAELRA
jgi:protein-tyrosine phosphatase